MPWLLLAFPVLHGFIWRFPRRFPWCIQRLERRVGIWVELKLVGKRLKLRFVGSGFLIFNRFNAVKVFGRCLAATCFLTLCFNLHMVLNCLVVFMIWLWLLFKFHFSFIPLLENKLNFLRFLIESKLSSQFLFIVQNELSGLVFANIVHEIFKQEPFHFFLKLSILFPSPRMLRLEVS
ncbi:MAG: hypothetical protein RL226_1739 [Bacteroidota bacterium]|jgi:hypothetical protein